MDRNVGRVRGKAEAVSDFEFQQNFFSVDIRDSQLTTFSYFWGPPVCKYVVRNADQISFSGNQLQASQKELTESHGCLDDTENRLDRAFPRGIFGQDISD